MIVTLVLAGMMQSLTGFGAALLAMPLLAPALGSAVAVPMFALTVIVTQTVMIVRYRSALMFRSVWRMVVAAMIGVPVGVFGAPLVDERLMLMILGVVVLAYGLYGLVTPRVPRLKNPRWAFPFGFAAGLLSGAYNTPGPPYVIYATTQNWTPYEFKANVQGAFLAASTMAVVSHAVKGNYTLYTLQLTALAIPAMVAGLFAGFSLDRFVPPGRLLRAVQLVLVVLGLSLIF
jgi:uncharacterized membrane protein YfcA